MICAPLRVSVLMTIGALRFTEVSFGSGAAVSVTSRKKIEEAKLLLSGTRMSIQDISDELSFGSRSFFFSSFQKETGMSPTAYRGEHCKG